MAAYYVILSLLAVLGGVAVAQQNEPAVHCCVDTKFTVVERLVLGQVNADGSEAGAVMSTRIQANNYDDKEIAAYITDTDVNGVVNEYKILESFDLGFGWLIKDGVCTQFEFEGNLPDNCVPYDRDIEYMGPLRYMGFVPAQSWRLVLWPEFGSRGISEFIVAEDGCMPIASSFRGQNNFNEPTIDTFEAGFFFNFTRGVDKTWFEIPNNCPQWETRNKAKNTRGKMPPPLYPSFFKRSSLDLSKIMSDVYSDV